MPKPGIRFALGLFAISLIWISCGKPQDGTDGPYHLSYGDSILYLKPGSANQVVHPISVREGVYDGFPDGIEIDDKTGAIDISKSETGLRYLVTHTAPNGTKTTTKVVISGITFTDKFYFLSSHDTVANPVYNASLSRPLPLAGSVFDEGGGASFTGCDVKTTNGQINLAQSIRNGLFGSTPVNDDRKDIEIIYRLNDASGKAVNKLRVRLYYYTSMATVAPDLLETLNDRELEGVFLRNTVAGRSAGVAKPRPPCVIIIAN